MKKIKAADNLVIELDSGHWQLTNGRSGERPLLAAVADSPVIVYRPVFAQARQLPPDDGLPVEVVDAVVVGWARSDRAWHLGLLLNAEIAAARGGRWCELAHWPDEFALLAAEPAGQAGEALAQVIRRPFRFVEAPHMAPSTRPLPSRRVQKDVSPSAPLPVETPPTAWGVQEQPRSGSGDTAAFEDAPTDWMKPAAGRFSSHVQSQLSGTESAADQSLALKGAAWVSDTLPEEDDAPTPVVRVGKSQEFKVDLPLELGDWTLRPINVGLQWAHTGGWSLSTIARIILNTLLGIAFIVVSALALRSPYAPVQPTGLPYLGILVGAGILYSALRLALSMMRTEAVVVDTGARQVRRHLDLTSDVVATYNFDEIRAVVVSQIVQQRHKGRDGQPDMIGHDAWLHLLLHEARQELGKQRRVKPEDAYVTLGYIGFTEGPLVRAHFEGKSRQRLPVLLYPDEAVTPAQKAALILARAIGVDAYIDQR